VYIGHTKAVDIDFTYLFPSSGLFTNVNLLFEFTISGQVVPTRFDITPYRLSPFANSIFESDTGVLDIFKFLLVIYQCYDVLQYIAQFKTFKKICRVSVFMHQSCEIMIILLQLFCFSMKVNDVGSFDLKADEYLSEKNRTHIPFYFMARNFRAQLIFEVISLLFMGRKMLDLFRVIQILNIILVVLKEGLAFISIFMIFFLVAIFGLVPLAQSIWGTYLFGYKTVEHTIGSVLMINYSKGNLEVLQDFNFIWSFIFVFLYYMIIVFFMHAAFHAVQADSVKQVNLKTGLKNQSSDPFEQDEQEVVVDLKR